MAIQSPAQTSRNVTIRQSPAFQIADLARTEVGSIRMATTRRLASSVAWKPSRIAGFLIAA
jgi:hypothetical protein